MSHSADIAYDVATAISQGRRARQEDSVASDFLAGSKLGFAVLADGMGGHAAGDVAAKIAVTEVFSGLKLWADRPEALEAQIAPLLRQAAVEANACIRAYVSSRPETEGMGATLLVPVVFADRLYWLSIGDSPLLLLRDGRLYRLNSDHSLAADLDKLVASGHMNHAEAAAHPDRDCVTSVLSGADIARIDCRAEPFALNVGDMILASSDGVLALNPAEIEELLNEGAELSSAVLSHALLARIERADAPEQDNVAFCLIKVQSIEQINLQHRLPPPEPRKRQRITLIAKGNREAGLRMTHRLTDIAR